MASLAAALSFCFLHLLSAADAAININIDINKILSAYQGFSAFNKLLAETGVANGINQQPSITVLAVDNARMSQLSRLSPDAVKNTLSLHVVLGYYDEAKLKAMHPKQPLLLTTLYQQSEKPQNPQGFLKMKHEGDDQVAFGSAVPGSKLDATFVKQITTLPERLSVLQVSNLINSADASNSEAPASSPSPRKVLAPAAVGPSLEKSPAPSHSPTRLPGAPAPSDASVGYGDYVASTILTVSLGFGFLLL
ncbi:hypothetical protein V6N13_033810 [Hibiscus sabdariffa]|uniref:FAS1 domain-containing protein n=1 Tax=Hibiscus sabdariffa TaxID=183260 RepID=A0ABR2F9H9_9ROSI